MEEAITITNKKGFKLAGILQYPDKNTNHAAVILLHGFTGYKEEPHIEALAKELVKNGFVAIRFDCSGSGDSEGTMEHDYRFSNYKEDIEAAYEYIKALSFVNSKAIHIWGHSMGGMLSILFASQHPELKSVISVSAPVYLPDATWIKQESPTWKERGWFDKETSRHGEILRIPYAFIEDAEQYNVLDFVDKLQQPLLVILGTNDTTVHPEDTRKIYESAHEPKELAEFEMGHDYKKYPDLIKKVNARILEFLS